MGRHRSRSPKSRNRSRDRENRHKSSKNGGSSRRSDSREKEQRAKDVQKGIDAAKSRMRASLSSAVNSVAEPSSSQSNRPIDKKYDISSTLGALDVNRQAEIDKIEEFGFKPAVFKSSAGGAGGRVKKQDEAVQKISDHEKAMFGSQWQGKALLNKTAKTETSTESPSVPTTTTVSKPEIPLAHESLSADPVAREEKWLKLFLERRQALLESQG